MLPCENLTVSSLIFLQMVKTNLADQGGGGTENLSLLRLHKRMVQNTAMRKSDRYLLDLQTATTNLINQGSGGTIPPIRQRT